MPKQRGIIHPFILIIAVVLLVLVAGILYINYQVRFDPKFNNCEPGDGFCKAIQNYRRRIKAIDKSDTCKNTEPTYGIASLEDRYILCPGTKPIDQEFIDSVLKEYNGDKEQAAWAFIDYGWKLADEKDLDTAMKRFNQAWLLNPNDFSIYWGYGYILELRGKYDQSLEMYEKSLSLEPAVQDQAAIMCDIANMFRRKGSNEKTEEYLQKFDSLLPKPGLENSHDVMIRAHCYHNLEEYSKAWKEIKKMRKLGWEKDIPEGLLENLSEKMPEPK